MIAVRRFRGFLAQMFIQAASQQLPRHLLAEKRPHSGKIQTVNKSVIPQAFPAFAFFQQRVVSGSATSCYLAPLQLICNALYECERLPSQICQQIIILVYLFLLARCVLRWSWFSCALKYRTLTQTHTFLYMFKYQTQEFHQQPINV